jgi:hypothetical protein
MPHSGLPVELDDSDDDELDDDSEDDSTEVVSPLVSESVTVGVPVVSTFVGSPVLVDESSSEAPVDELSPVSMSTSPKSLRPQPSVVASDAAATVRMATGPQTDRVADDSTVGSVGRRRENCQTQR